jgi:hypothetical protein
VNGSIKTEQKIEGDAKLIGSGRGTISFDEVIQSLQFEVIDIYGFKYSFDIEE